MRYNYPPQFMVAKKSELMLKRWNLQDFSEENKDFLHGTIDSGEIPHGLTEGRTKSELHDFHRCLVNGWWMLDGSGKFSWRILQMSHDVKDKQCGTKLSRVHVATILVGWANGPKKHQQTWRSIKIIILFLGRNVVPSQVNKPGPGKPPSDFVKLCSLPWVICSIEIAINR